MKKLMMVVAVLAFAAAARGESDGGRDDSRMWLPIGLSILTPPVQLPSPSHTVFGAMLNLGYGQVRNLVFGEVGVVNNVTDTMTGAQVGAVNIAGLALMVVGLVMNFLAARIADMFAREGKDVSPLVRMAGVMVCGVGAALVFI